MWLEKKMDSALFPSGETSNMPRKNEEDSVALEYLGSSEYWFPFCSKT